MGAETTVYVKILKPVVKLVEEWVEVQAVTLDDAVKEVKEDTFMVLDAQYDKPEE